MSTNTFEFDNDYSQDAWSADAVNTEAWNDSKLERERQERAEAAGAQDARHIGYAQVLEVYNNRSDTESLANRRSRELSVDPADQDFTRHVNYTGDDAGKAKTPPAPDTGRTAD